MKTIKAIQLVPSDFNSLDMDSHVFASQFTNPSDCPLSRAFKRRTNRSDIYVGISSVCIGGKYSYVGNIGSDVVEKAGTKLANGAKSVWVRLTKPLDIK